MSRFMQKKGLSWSLVFLSIVTLILLDVVRESMKEESGRIYTVGVARAEAPAKPVVSIVRSDNSMLKEPVDPDQPLSIEQVEDMVRAAVKLAGGLEQVLKPDAKVVVIKPNIVEVKRSGDGTITDWRVVHAVAKIAHEIAPDAKVKVVESCNWDVPDTDQRQDGWRYAGYRNLEKEPYIELVNMNYDSTLTRTIAGGGTVRDEYIVPKTMTQVDCFIDVPVVKVIGVVNMTAAMKNLVGMIPIKGYLGRASLPHTRSMLDETIVDLNLLHRVDFVVSDLIVGMERAKSSSWGGRPVRMNTILAGTDVVAVDAVSAQVIGLNPDDIEYLTLAQMRGLGVEDPDRIDVRGENLERISRRFEKMPDDADKYGQTPKIWTIKGPFPAESPDEEFLDPSVLSVVPGEDGWSEPIYFSSDKIDLKKQLGKPRNCIAYAYTDFVAPRDEPAELWVGSGEAMTIWIDGEKVYSFEGTRKHRVPSDKKRIQLTEGRHGLLVKVYQTFGAFDFSLSICEAEENPRYAGNRVKGLKFSVPTDKKPEVAEAKDIVVRDWEDYDFGYPKVVNYIEGRDPFEEGKSAPEKKVLEGFPELHEGLDYMAALRAVLSYRGEQVDLPYLMGISGEAFMFYYNRQPSRDMAAVSPSDPLQTVCDALGYTYAYSYNEEQDEAWIRLKGWISMGYPVMVYTVHRSLRWGVAVGYEEESQKVYVRLSGDRYRRQGGMSLFLKKASRWVTSLFRKSEEYMTRDLFLRKWMGRWPGKGDWFGNPQFVVGEKIRVSDPKEIVLKSLRSAVKLAVNGDMEQEEENWTRIIPGGFHAYRSWWEYLQRDIRYEELAEREREDLLVFDILLLRRLIRARRAAADYLDQIKHHFDPADSARLEEASVHYRTVVDRLAQSQKLLVQVLRQEVELRKGELSEEEIVRFAHRPKVAEVIREAYQEEHTAVRLLGEVVDMPVPRLETWTSVDEEIARGQKLLYWECLDFDGVDDLVVQDEEIKVDHLQWEPPEEMSYTFFRKLPRTERYHLTVKWLEGRGDIVVIQQPNAENDYTARIRIDDGWYDGAYVYRFEVYLVSER